MPVKSNKQRLMELIILLGSDSLLDHQMALMEPEEVLPFLEFVYASRYVAERNTVPKSIQWSELAFFDYNYDDKRFRSQFRMNRDAFNLLVNLISVNEVFNETQDPVRLQLGTALFRFGSYGNAASISNVATKFGISEGSVVNFTERVITALIQLSDQWIKWPDREERRSLGTEMAINGLPKCVGFVDGTDIILADAPLQNKETYWSRKKKYCIQAQIICDSRKRIRDLFVGYPGTVHDAKVFITSPIGSYPSHFFTEGEYIIGDSAYTLTDTVIVPFRKPQAGLSQEKKSFNCRLSEHRVAVENTIGLLKGRFQSLKGLRIRVGDETNGHKKACNWVHACAVLHNMLSNDDPWEDEPLEADEPEDDIQLNQNLVSLSVQKKGQLKRQALLQIHNSL